MLVLLISTILLLSLFNTYIFAVAILIIMIIYLSVFINLFICIHMYYTGKAKKRIERMVVGIIRKGCSRV